MNQSTIVKNFASANPQTTLTSTAFCFRAAFKWAAGQMVNKDLSFFSKSGVMNVKKTTDKHTDYRTSSRKTEASGCDFDSGTNFVDYVNADGNTAKNFINQWGASFSFDKTKFSGVSALDVKDMLMKDYFNSVGGARKPGMLFIYGFYGRGKSNSKTIPLGHAVAYSTLKNDPIYFDANHGEQSFATGEDIAAAAEAQQLQLFLGYNGSIQITKVFVLKSPV